MRCLLMLLLLSLATSAAATPKSRKKPAKTVVRNDDIRMWDGSVADVSWVNENTRPRASAPRREDRDWFTLALISGHRVFEMDTPMIQTDATQRILNEGLFEDLIETRNSFELRAVLHPFSFLSIGGSYHTDDSLLKINEESVPIAPQEFLGTIQVGPRFGFVRIYGFYSQILASRSQASITAPTQLGTSEGKRTFQVDVKQKGGEAGLGAQFNWGLLGLHAEALRSLNRSYDLSLRDSDAVTTFQAKAKPSFRAWQFGLSLNF